MFEKKIFFYRKAMPLRSFREKKDFVKRN